MIIFLQVPPCFLAMGPRPVSPSEGVHEPGYEARAPRSTRRCHRGPRQRCQEMPVSRHAGGSSGAWPLDVGVSRKDRAGSARAHSVSGPPVPGSWTAQEAEAKRPVPTDGTESKFLERPWLPPPRGMC